MNVKVVLPQYTIGDVVVLSDRRRGTVVNVYPVPGLPLWYGSERIIHTHCYQLRLENGLDFWGAVDAELTKVEATQ